MSLNLFAADGASAEDIENIFVIRLIFSKLQFLSDWRDRWSISQFLMFDL